MNFRIQIIDDNVALTTLLAKALSKFGYEPIVENNPLLAVNTVRHYMPDLILLDVMMPKRDGGRVLLDLRNDYSLRYIPVILLTAIAREAQALANTGGITSVVLAKPVQLHELLDVIKQQIEASRTYLQLQADQEVNTVSHHSIHTTNGAELPEFDWESPSKAAETGMTLLPQPLELPTQSPPSTFPTEASHEQNPVGQTFGSSIFSFPPRSSE